MDHHPPDTVASAAGKVILLGEHAVVYGRPALAVPLSDVRARATVTRGAAGAGVELVAEDLGLRFALDEAAPAEEALALQRTVHSTLEHLAVAPAGLNLRISVRSEVPIARGMGSGTAVATAIVRALAAHLGARPSPAEVSALVFRTEQLLHGTPSGVDNTVVAYERPVYFVRGQEPGFPPVGAPLGLLVGDTGVPSRTREAVEDVQRRWREARIAYEALFDEIGALVHEAREALAAGEEASLGRALDANHALLQRIGVSSAALDALVAAARRAGAQGAKLSGGGRGGVMIALVDEGRAETVAEALRAAGAARVYRTTLPATRPAASAEVHAP